MKNFKHLSILLTFFAFSLIGFYACEKNDLSAPQENDTVTLSNNGTSFESYKGKSFLSDLQNEDVEDSKVNSILYLIADAFKDVIKDPLISAEIMSKVQPNKDFGLSLLDFAAENPAFKEKLNAKLDVLLANTEIANTIGKQFGENNGNIASRNFDALDFLSKHIKYKDKVTKEDHIYDPVVYTVKDVVANGIAPNVAIGASVKGHIEKVPMWDSKDKEYVLSEKEAKVATTPILFIGNGEKKNGNSKDLVADNSTFTTISSKDDNLNVQSRAPFTLVLESFVLNPSFLFEDTSSPDGRPDVDWVIRSFNATGTIKNTPWPNPNSAVIAETNAMFPGRVMYNGLGFDIPTNATFASLAFYEYDWYASKKAISQCSAAAGGMEGRMKFSNEVYVRHCADTKVLTPTACPPFVPNFVASPGGNSCKITITDKGTFTIRRPN